MNETSYCYNTFEILLILTRIDVSIFSALALPGNLTVILITFCFKENRHKEHNWIIATLAMADFLFSATLFLSAIYPADQNTCYCTFQGMSFFFSGFAGFLFPPILAVDRYCHICTEHMYGKYFKGHKTVLILLGAWSYGFLLWLPFLLKDKIETSVFVFLCEPNVDTWSMVLYYNIGCTVTIIICYSAVWWCYTKLIKKLRTHASGVQFQSPVIMESKNLMKMMVIVSAIPPVVQIPAVAAKSLSWFLEFPRFVGMVAFWSFPLASMMNPYVVLVVVRPYRKVIKEKFFPRFFKKNRVNPAPVRRNNLVSVRTIRMLNR